MSDTETRSQRLTLLLVIDIQILQNCCSSRDAILIVAMSHSDAGDHHRDSRRFRPIELRLFQIDVMDNFTDRAECGIVQAHAVEQDFERAAIALMRKLGIEHVEAHLTVLWRVLLLGYEFEVRLWIDKTTDQPGACHPINVHACAGYPGPVVIGLSAFWFRRRLRLFDGSG